MSRLFQTLSLGLKSLLLHKLRSGLSVLGITIGVTAVIWLVAMGEGVSYQAQRQIEELGATNIILQSVKPPAGSSRNESSFVVDYGIKRFDFDCIVQTVPGIQQAVPMRVISKEARFGERYVDVRLVGCTPAYQQINHLVIARGRFLSDEDSQKVNNVCVLAANTAEKLFPYEDPLGRSVLLDTDFYTVVGITAARDAAAAIGGSLTALDYNSDIYIPLETLRWRIGDMVITRKQGSREGEIVELSQITLTVGGMNEVDETAGIVKSIIDRVHPNQDVLLTIPKELLRQAETLKQMFRVLLVAIAGIALLVGGIGIMNIMLATVTERTREIGIRRALGAKRKDIIYQFLSETVVLSSTGGVLGVLLGLLCPVVVSLVRLAMQQLATQLYNDLPANIQNLEPRLEPWSIVLAFGISVGVGVVFGLYPASRAAYMDPIEALRHE